MYFFVDRLTTLKNNPYVGSFHGVNIQPYQKPSASTLTVMTESKNNPMIGIFRHSPSVLGLGMKCIIYDSPADTMRTSVVSRLEVTRKRHSTISKENFVSSLKQLPVKVFASTPSGSVQSVSASSVPNEPMDDTSTPCCSICIEPYVDGDEIVTLACSHCFHSDCANRWFYHACLINSEAASFNCPECRQDHVFPNNARSSDGQSDNDSESLVLAEEISNMSFLRIGQSLRNERGYDFLSDVGTDTPSRQSVCSTSDNMHFFSSSNLQLVSSGLESPKRPSSFSPVVKSDTFDFGAVDNNAVASIHDDEVVAPVKNEKSSTETIVGVENWESPIDETACSVQHYNSSSNTNDYTDMKDAKVDKLLESTYSDCGFPLTKEL